MTPCSWRPRAAPRRCSVKRFAINKLGDSLANSGTTYAADDDPELVGQALPFSLKLVEGLLAESPQHRGLLFTAASGFTEYAYAYVQQDADMAERQSLAAATALRARARRLYLRARDYGLRALDVRYPRFQPDAAARSDSGGSDGRQSGRAAALLVRGRVGIGDRRIEDRPDLIADQLFAEALIDRAFALDPDFEFGRIHGFLISYEAGATRRRRRSAGAVAPAFRSQRRADAGAARVAVRLARRNGVGPAAESRGVRFAAAARAGR